MPPHDLEPPKFSRLALERILSDFNALKQILLFNHANASDLEPTLNTSLPSYFAAFDEDSGYVDSQSGSIDLDKFIYFLVVKSPNDLLVLLVETIKKNLQQTESESTATTTTNEAALVVKRLVRSCARLFTILCMETFPSNLSIDLTHSSGGNNISTKKSGTTTTTIGTKRISFGRTPIENESYKLFGRKILIKTDSSNSSTMTSLVSVSPVAKCEYIFKEFPECAALELADMAHGLISPVILGMCKPSVNKLLSGQSSGGSGSEYPLADELFNLEPSSQRLNSYLVSTNLVKVKTAVRKEEQVQTVTQCLKMPPPPASTSSSTQDVFVVEADGASSASTESERSKQETSSLKSKRTHSNSSLGSKTGGGRSMATVELSSLDDDTTSSSSNTGFSTMAVKNAKLTSSAAKRRNLGGASTSSGGGRSSKGGKSSSSTSAAASGSTRSGEKSRKRFTGAAGQSAFLNEEFEDAVETVDLSSAGSSEENSNQTNEASRSVSRVAVEEDSVAGSESTETLITRKSNNQVRLNVNLCINFILIILFKQNYAKIRYK